MFNIKHTILHCNKEWYSETVQKDSYVKLVRDNLKALNDQV